jgi:hypothetical protein
MKPALILAFVAQVSLSVIATASNVYPVRLSNVTATGDVDEVFFSASDITLSITNLPGGGRRAVISIIGGGSGGEGGSNNTILVAGNGLSFTDLGDGSNSLAIDSSVVMTNGGFIINVGTATFNVQNGGSITIPMGSGGITNVLDTAGGPYDLVGHTNQPTLLIKGITNQTPTLITITDFGTMLGFSVASQGGFGSTNAWTTNGLPWAVSDTFGFSNASSIVGLAFTNLGGVPTIYLVPDGTIARTGQSQTWTAPQNFNSSAPLTFGAPTWFKSSVTVSDNVTVVSNATVGGNATISGSVNAGTFTGSVNGGNIIGNQSIGTNLLAAFSGNTGTFGSAGNFLVLHFNSAGIIDGVSTVAGSSQAAATNAISSVQNANTGSALNNVVGLILTNFSDYIVNGSTVTVGFVSAPFESITVLNAGTNFTLHGSSLTFSNLLSAYGIILTNRSNNQIDLGGTVTMLSNSTGAFNQLTGSSANSTQNWSGSTLAVVTLPANGQALKFIPNGAINGIQSEIDVVPQDGSNASYLMFNRDGPKAGLMFISWNDSSAGNVCIGQEPNGNAPGDKRCANLATSTSVGGLIVVNQDNDTTGLAGYQFYEDDPRFPRILFTNGKQSLNTNTPDMHETYSSFGNWTNSGGSATMNGGALICIGSNEYWLVAAGRALGSVTGTEAKEYPTNAISGFIAQPLNSIRSNLTSVAVRDEINSLWLLSVSTNTSPPTLYLGTTNNPIGSAFVPAIVNNGQPSLIVVTNGYTIDAYFGGLLSNSVPYVFTQDTNIVINTGVSGITNVYSSFIPTLKGATISPSPRTSDGGAVIALFEGAISNSATFNFVDLNSSLSDQSSDGCISCVITASVHFFR